MDDQALFEGEWLTLVWHSGYCCNNLLQHYVMKRCFARIAVETFTAGREWTKRGKTAKDQWNLPCTGILWLLKIR